MSENVAMPPESTPSSNKKMKIAPIITTALIVGGLAWACASQAGGGDDAAVKDYELRQTCQEWASTKLKAPSTAEFSDETVTPTGTDKWLVKGAVDAENSFGAKIRSTYECEIRLDGDMWRGSARIIG